MSKIIVRDIETGVAVHEIDTTKLSASQAERAERGLLAQMDRERFYTETVS